MLMFHRFWPLSCILAALLIPLVLTTPAMATASAGPLHPAVAQVCTDLLQNSDMESNSGWLFAASPAPAVYTNEQASSPTRSVRLGITSGGNFNSYSSMRQAVVVPAGAQLRLRLQVFQLSQPLDTGDVQEIRILDGVTGATLRQVWSDIRHDARWRSLQFDLSEFLGQNIFVYINVRNNGVGGVAAMYVDDVHLEVCSGGGATLTPTSTPPSYVTPTPTLWVATPTPTPPLYVTPTPTLWVATPTPTPPLYVTPTPTLWVATPTPTPPLYVTPTPTPTRPTPTSHPTYTPIPTPPGGCKECLLNTGFEQWGYWTFGRTQVQGSFAAVQVHAGLRSALLGNDNPHAPNYVSYSSVRQRVTLPRKTIKTAVLTFWHYTASDGEAGDYQEAVILDAYSGRTLEILWRENRNDRAWHPETRDLTRYLGKSILIYFNVYNNGGSGRASMYIDDVTLTICGDSAASGSPPTKEIEITPAFFTAQGGTPTPNVWATIQASITATPVVLVTPAPKGFMAGIRRFLQGFSARGGGLLGLLRNPVNCLACVLILLVTGAIFFFMLSRKRRNQGPPPP